VLRLVISEIQLHACRQGWGRWIQFRRRNCDAQLHFSRNLLARSKIRLCSPPFPRRAGGRTFRLRANRCQSFQDMHSAGQVVMASSMQLLPVASNTTTRALPVLSSISKTSGQSSAHAPHPIQDSWSTSTVMNHISPDQREKKAHALVSTASRRV
jgi:hypothetical protein